MATLYFNDATHDHNWNTLGNWWQNSGFTVHAAAIPGTGDTAYVEGSVGTGPSTAVTLASLFVCQINPACTLGSAGMGITVTGDLTVGTYFNTGGTIANTNLIVHGTAYFFNSTYNNDTLTVGLAVFNGASFLNGSSTVTGNAEFNDTSLPTDSATVNGNATFNDNSAAWNLKVLGIATFNDNSINRGTLTGSAVFNDRSFSSNTITANAEFNDFSYNGSIVAGNATFNGHSVNNWIVERNAIFRDYSSNNQSTGSISLNATVYYPAQRPLAGVVSGTIFYYNYPSFYFNAASDHTWNTQSNWWRDANFSIHATTLPQNGDTVSIEGNLTTGPTAAVTLSTLYVAQINSGVTLSSVGAITLAGDLVVGSGIRTFGQMAALTGISTFHVGGSARFYGNGTTNAANLTVGTAYFYLGASNYGTGIITGNAVFRDNANNSYSVSMNGMFSEVSTNMASSIGGDSTFIDSSSNASGGVVATNATFKNASTNVGSVSGNASVYYPATKPVGGSVTGTITYFNYPP